MRQDPLTHLPNRVAFNEALNGALSRLERSGEEFAVLLLDLDRFKEINDRFGHPAGDELLVQLAARLQRCTRAAEHVARIGGDEFALIMSNLTRPDDALAIAERFVAAFADPFPIDGFEITSAISIGIVLAPRDGNTSHDLLKHVDIALYRAKKSGPGTIRFFEASDDQSARDRRALQRDLEQAIEADQLFLVYQPFLDIRKGRVTGFEALLRWQHPTRGLIPPSVFIPIAEESGLIHQLGEWVIRRACAMLSRWPDDIRIAVNFSAVQFQNVGILQTIVEALAEANVAPNRLEIEITESMLISKYGSAPAILNGLLELGLTVALDDFGTGFSSADLSAQAAVQPHQDRSILHPGHADPAGLRGDRQIGDRPRAGPADRRRGRRRRDRGSARIPAPDQLRRGAGLFDRPADVGQRYLRAARSQSAAFGARGVAPIRRRAHHGASARCKVSTVMVPRARETHAQILRLSCF
ncbi:diguanylate cyclase (GGDEF)-like protein [Bradyrhizobium sp. JR3.5]